MPVSPAPDEAARTVLASLDERFDSIVTSPTARASTLAEALAHALKLSPPRIDERLCELDFGHWEGRPWSELEHEESFGPWMRDWERACVPGGESAAELVVRVNAALADYAGSATLLVTHAGPIRVMRALSRGKTLAEVWSESVPHLRAEALE